MLKKRRKMFKIITLWNLSRPDKEIKGDIKNIKLRGYDVGTYLTGEFAAKIANKELKSLSVSDIADNICPSRRDLYIKKGKNKPRRIIGRKTWGRVGGRVVEKFKFDLFNKFCTGGNIGKYSTIKKKLDGMSDNFKASNQGDFTKLNKLKIRAQENPEWLLKLLNYGGREELGLKLLHKKLFRGQKEIDLKDLRTNHDGSLTIKPTPKQIGISKNVKPDFIIERHNIIGDIKSGVGGFQDRYLLTCVGYSLAYENAMKKDMNFGVIYFFSTRQVTDTRIISYPQLYVFPIDDNVRKYFIDVRNRAYSIISKNSIPKFPKDKSHCSYCKFQEYCIGKGLTYEG